MDIQIAEYISAVKDESVRQILGKFQNIAMDAAKTGCEYAYDQCKIVYKYLKQKKDGDITEDEFKSLLKDLTDIMKLESLKTNVETRLLINELIDVCLKIAQDSIAVLIVF